MKTIVIKLGGVESEDPQFLNRFAVTLAQMREQMHDVRIVLVHGGGRAITQLQAEAGIPYQTIDGLRVTDARTLEIVKLVLWKKINTEIVNCLNRSGLKCVGLAGFENSLIRAEKITREDGQDLGFVGTVTGVNVDQIESSLVQGQIVVIAPLGVNAQGQAFNINADSAALGVALALGAESIRFVTNVPGVLRDGKKIDRLTLHETESLISDGTIQGGMIPKVRAALSAVEAGIPQVWITQDGQQGTVFQ